MMTTKSRSRLLPATLSLLIAFGASPLGASVTFFSYSDCHFLEGHTNGDPVVNLINALPGTPYPAAIGGVVATPRAVIMQGDLINDGAVANKYPVQWANYIADFGVNGEGRCQFPVFEGIGNHDVNLNLFAFNQVKARNNIRQNLGYINHVCTNGYHYSWDWDGVHFVNLNLFAGNVWHGEADAYGKAHHPQFARDFLIADLKKNVGNSGRPVVITQHYRPIDENWWTHSSADQLHKVLQDYNVILILVGHQGGGVNNVWRGFNWVSSNGILIVLGITDDNKMFAISRSTNSWGPVFQKNIHRSYATSGLPAVVNNGDWVLNASAHSATVSGKILYAATNASQVTVYWGTNDAGKSAANWQHSKSLGPQNVGEVFSTRVEGLQPWTTYYYRCRVTNNQGSAWAEASIPFTTKGTLPAGWRTDFVGYEQRSWGGAHHTNGLFALRGSGRDIGEGSEPDNFQYAYKSLDGNGEIIARVASMVVDSRDPKAGIMMRETLENSTRSVSVLLSSKDGARLYSRATTGGTTTKSAVNALRAPYWVRLTRTGNTFTGYMSQDGDTWTQVGAPVTLALSARIQVGLAVTGGNRDGSKNHNATFDSVTITGNTTASYEHWRSQHFTPEEITDDWISGRLADCDSDGFNNEQEYLADTDPNDDTSLLAITGLEPASGGWRVNWRGGRAARQVLESTSNPAPTDGTWSGKFTNHPPTSETHSFVDMTEIEDGRFYRIKGVRP